MSIPDLADRLEPGASMVEEIRLTAERRLRQIEPLIEEAERLRDVLDALERRPLRSGTVQGGASIGGSQLRTKGERPLTRERDGRSRRAGAPRNGDAQPRAAKGANKRVIIELVGRSPGITPAEISAMTNMKRTVVASTVSRLKRHGELCDHERGGLCLPSPEGATPTAERGASVSQRPIGGGEERPRRLASLPRRRAA